MIALIGLFMCTGLPEALFPSEFRLLKHAFYALIIGLLLLRWQATLRLAARDLVLCAFAFLLPASALWSALPAWAFKRGAVMMQTTAFGLYLASRFSPREQLRALCFVVVPLLVAFAASALLDPANAFGGWYGGAFRGPLPHKNQVGLLMAVTIPALLLQMQEIRRGRLLFGIPLVAAGVFLVLARSLGGLLVATMLCAVVAAQRAVRPPRRGLLLLPVLAVALATAAAVAGLLDPVLIAFGKDPTLTGRTEIWDHTLHLFSQRPLLGYSPASFWQLEIVASTGAWFPNAHNGYLQLLIELGLIGVLLFVVQLLTSFTRALAYARRSEPAALWPFCIAAFVLVYNLIEVSVVAENSIVWVLYVAAGFAVRAPLPRLTRLDGLPTPARTRRSALA